MHTFEEIVGYESHKKELRTVCDILRYPGKYKKLGVRTPHALMIYGEPGHGKTLMAKALIDESGRKCFCCGKSMKTNDFCGAIRETFELAAADAPSVVFFDDIDKFAEDNLREDCNKEEFATIQACLEEYVGRDLFVIATANDLSKLPESIMRPGRFGKKMYVGPPSQADFLEISGRLLRGIKTEEEDLPGFVTRLIGGRSPALLEEVMNEAGIRAVFRGDGTVTKDDIAGAALDVVYGIREDCFEEETERTQYMRRLKAYHEAGHAVAAMALGRPVAILTAAGSGRTGGVTMLSCPQEISQSFKDVESAVLVLLGGRAAVETVMGEKECGAASDFARAAELLRECCEKRLMFGFEYGYDLDSWDSRGSDRRKDEVNSKIYSILEGYFKEACGIIEKNRELTNAIAGELVDRTYLTYEDTDRISSRFGIRRR